MRPSLGTALSVAPRPSVCPSVRPSVYFGNDNFLLKHIRSLWNVVRWSRLWARQTKQHSKNLKLRTDAILGVMFLPQVVSEYCRYYMHREADGWPVNIQLDRQILTDRNLTWQEGMVLTRTTNRKWHMGYRMVTWPMTSRDLERSNSWPHYA